MRYWLLSLAVGLIVIGIGSSQAIFVSAQGKDKKKDPPKDGKDGKDKKIDPKEIPSNPDFKEPDEVLGKGFKYWQNKIHSDDPSEREIAIKNILFFGTDKSYQAVPDILAELTSHKGNKNIDLSMRVNAIQALSTIFRYKKNPDPKHVTDAYNLYVPALTDTQVILRMQTMKALPYLGPIARDSFKTVLKLGKDPVSWEIRKEAIPVIVVLAAPEIEGGKPNPLASDALIHLKNRANPNPGFENSHLVRQAALQGIAILGEHVPPELYKDKGLDDPSLPVRLTALQCFAAMSQKWDAQDKKFAENKLLDYLDREKDVPLNMWTHAVIMTIHKKISPKHMNPILNRLTLKDTPVRLLALQIIAMAGPEAKPLALPAVLSAVRESEVSVGVAAIQTLVAIRAYEAKSTLKSIVDDKKSDDHLHDAALAALETFELHEKMEKEKKDKKDKKSDDKK
jgi:hypothetical protein